MILNPCNELIFVNAYIPHGSFLIKKAQEKDISMVIEIKDRGGKYWHFHTVDLMYDSSKFSNSFGQS